MKLYLMMDAMMQMGIYAAGLAIVSVIIEAFVLFLFKVNGFVKCLIDSVMANIGSVLFLVLIILIFNKMDTELEGSVLIMALVGLYIVIALFESWIIKLLNTTTSWGKILLPVFIMNLPVLVGMYLMTIGEITL